MKQLVYILITLALLPALASAQVLPNFGGQRAGLSTLGYLKTDMNPRSLAMGGSSVALDGEVLSLYTNPAGIASQSSFGIATSNHFLGAGVNQAFLGAVLPTGSGGAFGLSVNTLSSGEMEVRTEFQPLGTGQRFYATNIASGLTYAKKLSDMFSFGITLKHVYEQLAQYNNHTVAADLGFLYSTDFKDLNFAVVLQNFGGNSSLSGDDLEVTFNRVGNPSTDNYTIPTIFKLGASMVPYKTDNYALLVSFELNHPSDNAENYRIGAEFDYRDLFFLRGGYKLNVAGQSWPTFGVGVRHQVGAHPFRIAYAANPTNFLGVQHSLSLSFSINKMER